jgi:hypothetical protein
VLRAIRRLKGQPRIFGRCAGLSSFLRDQAAIQLRRISSVDAKGSARAEALPEGLP